MSLEDQLRANARAQGPIAPGAFRVSVLEQDLRITHHDFATRGEASAYATDAMYESGDERAIAYVFDDQFLLVKPNVSPP